MRTRVTSSVALAGSLLLLTACVGGDTNTDTQPADEDVTLQLFHDKTPWEGDFDELSEAGLDATGITLAQTPYSDQDAYRAFIRQSFATTERPDLFTWWVGGELLDLVQEGVIEPTTDLWDEAIANGNVSADLAEYFTFEGEQYCVPMLSSPWLMYYSKAAFAEHNLTPPSTWAELTEVAETFVAAGVPPILQASGVFAHAWPGAMIAGTDPDLYASFSVAGDGSGDFTSPGAVRALEEYAKITADGWFGAAGTYTGATDAAAQLRDGDAAMIYFGSWYNGILKNLELVPGEDYGVFLLPNVDSSLPSTSVIVEPGPLCSASGSANPEATKEYLRWWMGADAQGLWADRRGDFSFNPQAAVPDEGLNVLNQQIAAEGRQFLKIAEHIPAPVRVAMNDAIDGFIANPSDAMTLLELIQAENERYWSGR